ncbi:TPA: WbuC family cupin fold metalloprotein [Escherichia coli]
MDALQLLTWSLILYLFASLASLFLLGLDRLAIKLSGITSLVGGVIGIISGITQLPGTYVRPHRHPHTFELLLPLRGRFVVLNFDDRGTVTHRAILGETCTVLEMAAGTWHAVLSLDTGGIIFEVKHGGYQPVAADDYAHWAPAEGEPGTTELMAWYAQAQVGDSAFAV